MENVNVNLSNNVENMEFMKSVDWIITSHKIFGIISIIQGVLISLSIAGLIGGVPLILAGLKLMESSKNLNEYKLTKDTKNLKNFFIEYRKYWVILLITIIVSIVSIILLCLIFDGAIIALIQSIESNSY